MSNDNSFDLTIENYNFQELLHLFKMDWDFDLDEDLNDFNNDSNDFNKQLEEDDLQDDCDITNEKNEDDDDTVDPNDEPKVFQVEDVDLPSLVTQNLNKTQSPNTTINLFNTCKTIQVI